MNIIRHILYIIVLVVAALPAKAHVNTVLDKRLKPIAQRAYNCRRDARVLAICDTLYKRATAINDGRGKVIARMLPLQYKSLIANDDEALLNQLNDIYALAHRYQCESYYYLASLYIIDNYYLRKGMTDKAYALVQHNQSITSREHNSIGYIYDLIAFGDVLSANGEIGLALRYLRFARDYSKEQGFDYMLGSIELRIVAINMFSGRFEFVLEDISTNWLLFKDASQQAAAYGYKALASFMLQKYSAALEAYNEYKRLSSIAYPEMFDDDKNLVDMLHTIAQDNKKAIKEQYERLTKKNKRYRLFTQFAYLAYNNKYKEAEEVVDSIMRIITTTRVGSITKDIDEYSNTIHAYFTEQKEQKAQYEQDVLQLSHSRLQLQNTNLELSHATSLQRLAQIEAEHNALTLQNKQQRTTQLKQSLKQQQTLNKVQREKSASEFRFFLIIVAMVAVLFVLMLLYLMSHAKRQKRLNTLSKRLEATRAELAIANTKAVESEQQKTQFIRNMSHEVRTPLHSIMGFSQMLTDPEMMQMLSKQEKSDIIKYINDSSEQLSKLINDILDLTSLESGKYQMHFNPVCIDALCQKAIDHNLHYVKPNVEMRYENICPPELTISTDEGRVMQLLTNLLENAAQHTEKGCITLAVSDTANPGFITFTVTDTGSGISEEEMDKIFTRFHKVDSFKQGTGLGLDICRVIATKLGGNINIDHNYTSGARFWCTLPMLNEC